MGETTTAEIITLADGGYFVSMSDDATPTPRRLPVQDVADGVALAATALQATGVGTAAFSDAADFATSGQIGDIATAIESILGGGDGPEIVYTGTLPGPSVSIQALGALGDGTTNDFAAFNAVAAGTTVEVPFTAAGYLLANAISPAANTKWVFAPGARLIFAGAFGHLIQPAGNGVEFHGAEIDATAATGADEIFYLNGRNDCLIEVRRITAGAVGRGAVLIENGARNRVLGGGPGRITNIGTNAVVITGATSEKNEIDGLHFEGVTPGLCILIASGAHHTTVANCTSLDTGAELLGIQWDCHDNTAINCYAENAGDSGFSITGKKNILIGCKAVDCEFHGFAVFGQDNLFVGCESLNNGKAAPNVSYSGFSMYSNYGGISRNNRLVGCIADDDQVVKSQAYGIRFAGQAYGAWATATIYAVRAFVRNGNNLYEARTAGTSGATAPTHTSGDVSDGAVTWRFVITDAGGFYPTGNRADVKVLAYGTAAVSDQGTGHNVWSSSETDIPSNRLTGAIVTAWATATAVVFGDIRFAAETGGPKNLYVAVGSGTTGATKPFHTTGTASDGVVSWRYLGTRMHQDGLDMIDGIPRVHNKLSLVSPGGFTRAVHLPNVSPEGVITESVGALALRYSGGVGVNFYIKETGVDTNTGWLPLECRRSGTTASRPGSLNTGHTGLFYFDTTLGKPIWWKGSVWVDAAGVSA